MRSNALACGGYVGGTNPTKVVGVVCPFPILDRIGVAKVIWKDRVGANFIGG